MQWFILCGFIALTLEYVEVSAFLWSPSSHLSCDKLPEYKNIINTLKQQSCTSDTQIWQMLVPLQKKSHTCLQQLISNVAGYIETHNIDRTGCHCSHNFAKEHYIGYGRDHLWACLRHNSNCEYLYNYFYLRIGETNARSNCQSNVHVWRHLRDIRSILGVDEQSEIISHLSSTFSNGRENACTCREGTHNEQHSSNLTTSNRLLTKSTLKLNPLSTATVTHTKSTVPESTYTSASASTTGKHNFGHSSTDLTDTKSTPTTAQNPQTVSSQTILSTNIPLNITTNCQKYKSLSEIAAAELASHPLAYLCQSGNRTSNEAFVLVNCKVGSPENWIEGPNVMTNCGSIPTYTPIATFKTGYAGVHDQEGLSGIFLGCIPGGFKLAFQDCDTRPTIKHVEIGSGSGIDEPYNYFVIA